MLSHVLNFQLHWNVQLSAINFGHKGKFREVLIFTEEVFRSCRAKLLTGCNDSAQ